jgi:hypothetical protein
LIRYLDADWVAAGGPAIVVDGDSIRCGEGPAVEIPPERRDDPDALAAAALRAVAAEAVSRVPGHVGGVKVLGEGLVAAEARRLLGARAGESSAYVIDATGDPDAIAGALGGLDDHGTLVAAGPLGERPFPINLYSDIHLRGLRLVGVAPPLAGGALPEPAGDPGRVETGLWLRQA